MNKCSLLVGLMAMAVLLPLHFALAAQDGSVKLANTHLILLQQEQVCHIKQQHSTASAPSPARSLNLAWPCQFHLQKDGKVRVLKRGKYEYLMVESSRPIANSRDCETEMRAIRARAGARAKTWEISEHSNKVASCPPFQWDAIVFGELFEKP